jgi:hypothetical protein
VRLRNLGCNSIPIARSKPSQSKSVIELLATRALWRAR